MFYGSAAISCDNAKWVVLFVRFYETCNCFINFSFINPVSGPF